MTDSEDMIAAPPHINEARRLAALRRLGILDSAPEERFDRITRLAATILGSPISLVSLVDKDRQWFKSSVGLPVKETHRDLAFCAHAINDPSDVFVVDNALEDERFFDSPLVLEYPDIRFYAGRVLRSDDGLPLGTLCVIDREARTMDTEQKQALIDLATLAEQELARAEDGEFIKVLDASEKRRSLILSTVTEGVILQAGDGNVIDWNPAAEKVLGLSADELSGLTSFYPRWETCYEDGTPWPGETHPSMEALRTGCAVLNAIMGVSRPDGSRVWLRVNSQPVLNGNGIAESVVTAFSDFTLEHELSKEQRRYAQIFKRSNDIITIVDANFHLLFESPSAKRLLGYPEQWEHEHGVLALIHPDDQAAAGDRMVSLLTGTDDESPLLVRVLAQSGEWRFLESVAINLLNDPVVGGIVIMSRDVTDRQELSEKLAHSAAHDELTQLPNRRTLAAHIDSGLDRARREARPIGLCFVDLDGFKKVNDTYGHAAGDALLIHVARLLQSAIRPGDLAARIGGDEFVIVIDPVMDLDEAMMFARSLRTLVETKTNVCSPGFGASVGLAISEPDDTSSSLLQRADTALYRAKECRSGVETAGGALQKTR